MHWVFTRIDVPALKFSNRQKTHHGKVFQYHQRNMRCSVTCLERSLSLIHDSWFDWWLILKFPRWIRGKTILDSSGQSASLCWSLSFTIKLWANHSSERERNTEFIKVSSGTKWVKWKIKRYFKSRQLRSHQQKSYTVIRLVKSLEYR